MSIVLTPGAAQAFAKVVADIIEHDQHFSFDERAMLFAIIDAEDPEEPYETSKDSLILIEWLHQQGCPLHLHHARVAAEYNLLDLLTWLRSMKCPIDNSIWRSNVENFQYTGPLIWAQENGFDWKYKGICKHLTELDLPEVLKWAHDNGCRCTGHCKKYRHALCGKYVNWSMARHRWRHIRTYAKAIGKLLLLFKCVRRLRLVDAGKGFVDYIYLLQLRECIKNNEPVYKVGMSKQYNLERFNQYPKGSVLCVQIMCSNCRVAETTLLRLFRAKYKKRSDYGSEYFEGNPTHMITDMITVVNELQQKMLAIPGGARV
jgi:hypothetical protein